MRRIVALVAAPVLTLAARSALAASLCDPAGQFCILIDTTSARVCAPLRPGGWNTATCEQADGEVRTSAKRLDEGGIVKEVDALIIRFGDWMANVALFRGAPEPEVADDAGPTAMNPWTQGMFRSQKTGWMFEEVGLPSLSRINLVQVVRQELRISGAGIGGVMLSRSIAYEVRARDATYMVLFGAGQDDARRLVAVADASIATLDTLPVGRPGSASEALVWLVRIVVAALVLVGLGWLVSRLKGRRGGIDSRDLWPR